MLGVATATAGTPVDDAAALFTAGRALLDAGKPAEACAKFEAAIQLDPEAPGTMLNLGLCNRELRRYATALKWFRKAQTHSSVDQMQEHEDAAKQMTAELAVLVPSITIAVTGVAHEMATVRVDHVTIAPVDFANFELDP